MWMMLPLGKEKVIVSVSVRGDGLASWRNHYRYWISTSPHMNGKVGI